MPEESAVRTGEKRVVIGESLVLSGPCDIVTLPHPKTNSGASFFLSQDNQNIREVITYKEDNRCWFIENCIESNGNLYFLCSFDPLLILIPYLQKCSRLEPLEHLVKDSDFPDLHRLTNPIFLKHMSKIADRKGSEDLNVWKYNEEKTLDYLSNKTKRLSQTFAEEKVNVTGGAVSGNFVKSLNQTVEEGQYLKYAFGVTCEYIDADLAEKLRKHLDLPEEEDESKKRASDVKAQSANKRSKLGNDEGPTEDYSKDFKKGSAKESNVQSAKQKALAKSASGTKSITSFFTKK